MKEKKPLHMMWKRAKMYTEQKNVEKAVPLLETMIVYLAKLSNKDIKMVEGVKVDLMKDRAWLSLESLGVVPEYNEVDEKYLKSMTENSLDYNKDEFVSLFDYFGKPVGGEIGQEVFEQAKNLVGKYEVRILPFKYKDENGKTKNKIMIYKREFLDWYFSNDSVRISV